MASQVTNYKCPACTGPLHFVGASGKLSATTAARSTRWRTLKSCTPIRKPPQQRRPKRQEAKAEANRQKMADMESRAGTPPA